MHDVAVSIIIVNYNTRELLRNCLASVYEKTSDISFETIVSDNGSKDGSIEMVRKEFPQVILLENDANLGFGTANNRGLEIAKGRYIFYLNSDTVLLNNAVRTFFDYWESHAEPESIGALGCNLTDEKGNCIHSYANFPDLRRTNIDLLHSIYGFSKLSFFHLILNHPLPENSPERHTSKFFGEVDYITGADLFLKNDRYAKFDEKYFLYCEETDLEYQLHKAGKKRLIIDGPEIVHLVNGSFKNKKGETIRDSVSPGAIHNMVSRIYFFKKNGAPACAIGLLKFLTLLFWLNPLIFTKTKKYIRRMLSV